VQVPGLFGGELEGAREGVKDLFGRPYVAALLHALVVVRAHPASRASSSRRSPATQTPRAGFEADVFRPHSGPACSQELGQLTSGSLSHRINMPPAGPVRVGLVDQERANDRDAAATAQDRIHPTGEER
jgi:hypothetical protein